MSVSRSNHSLEISLSPSYSMTDYTVLVLLSFFRVTFGYRVRFLTLGIFVDFVLIRSSDDIRIFFLKFIAIAYYSFLKLRPSIEKISLVRCLTRSLQRFDDVDWLLNFNKVLNHLFYEQLDNFFCLSFV